MSNAHQSLREETQQNKKSKKFIGLDPPPHAKVAGASPSIHQKFHSEAPSISLPPSVSFHPNDVYDATHLRAD